MADDIKCTITGLDAFLRELQALPQVLQTRLMKGATATACSVIRQEAIRQAPEYTSEVSQGRPPPGTLKKAIYQARALLKCTSTREVWVIGVRMGKAARHSGSTSSKFGPTQGKNLDAYYASWVEFGHYTRGPKASSGARVKHMKGVAAGTVFQSGAHFVLPRPFMRPSFETKKAEALRAFWQYLQDRLHDAVRRIAFIKVKR